MINWRQRESGRFPQWNPAPQTRDRRPAYQYQQMAPQPGFEERYSERGSDPGSQSELSGEPKPMTEADKAILKDLDLLDDDDSVPAPEREFNPVLTANPLESFSLERSRSRELEKEDDQKELSQSRSVEISITKKRRLKKIGEVKETPRAAPARDNLQARLMDKKLENLKRHTGQLGEKVTRRVSESTKPSLNLMIPKGFESKESFSRRFKVLESLGEGGSSIVRKVSCRRDGKVCAVKSCKSNDDSSTKYIKKELKILQSLSHPNIIKPYGIFESTSNVALAYSSFILS